MVQNYISRIAKYANTMGLCACFKYFSWQFWGKVLHDDLSSAFTFLYCYKKAGGVVLMSANTLLDGSLHEGKCNCKTHLVVEKPLM